MDRRSAFFINRGTKIAAFDFVAYLEDPFV
jgi:hypothetical protein